jgi:hypothetical protein
MNPQIGALIAQIIPVVVLADILVGALRRVLDPAIALIGRAAVGLPVGLTDGAVTTVYLEVRARSALFCAILIALAHSEAAALTAADGTPTSHAELIVAETAIVAGIMFGVVLPVFEEILTLLAMRAPTTPGYRWKRAAVWLILAAGTIWAAYPLARFLPPRYR